MRSLILTILLASSQSGFAQVASTDALLFRSIFASLIDPDGSKQDKVDRLIYAPVPELLSGSDRGFTTPGSQAECSVGTAFLHESSARRIMCAMQKQYAQADATAFYDAGKNLGRIGVDLRELTHNLKQQDLLIVVVPGIFGEFIKGRAFEEVFEKDSAFAREFKAQLDLQTRALIGDKQNCERVDGRIPVCDMQSQLSRLTLDEGSSGAKNVPMGELLNVGSIDDNGEAAAKVVLFQMDGMTLESLGPQKDRAEIFTRRLEKFFQIMNHVPKNIAFVGYSRGTAFALEMLAQARAAHKPWLANVRAVVSLGGVVFGSALADEVVTNTSSKGHCQIELVELLNKILRPLPAADKNICDAANRETLRINTVGWYRFGVANARFASGRFTCDEVKDFHATRLNAKELQNAVSFLVTTALQQRNSDPDFGRKMLLEQSVKFGLIDGELSMGRLLVLGSKVASCVQAEDPAACLCQLAPETAKYNTDILRFRKLFEAIQQGVGELSTDSRLQWWREHVIPTEGVRYYSVSGTMADPNSPLMSDNRYGYNPGSPDDKGLIQNWKDFANVNIGPEYAGVNLNDSQVAIYKTAFWPHLIRSLNEANANVRATPLAVVGTHHWGMALPIVTEISRGSGLLRRNPFPRAALMKSIALSIANDIRVDDAARGDK